MTSSNPSIDELKQRAIRAVESIVDALDADPPHPTAAVENRLGRLVEYCTEVLRTAERDLSSWQAMQVTAQKTQMTVAHYRAGKFAEMPIRNLRAAAGDLRSFAEDVKRE